MSAVPSPCIGICRINVKAGLCEGCYRTQKEIVDWVKMGSDQQQKLVLILEQRQAEATDV